MLHRYNKSDKCALFKNGLFAKLTLSIPLGIHTTRKPHSSNVPTSIFVSAFGASTKAKCHRSNSSDIVTQINNSCRNLLLISR